MKSKEERLQRDMTRWERRRQRGAIRYVLEFGVLRWGAVVGLFFGLITGLTDSNETVWASLRSSMIVFPLTGIFFGVAMWLTEESRFRRWRSTRDAT